MPGSGAGTDLRRDAAGVPINLTIQITRPRSAIHQDFRLETDK
ncbi:MAG: hypothetical protein AAF800_00850 [Planctomycetota bacterium]